MKNTEVPVGTVIKNRRKVLGMSQMKLAEKIGVTYQMVQKYESGKSQLTLHRLHQIAKALDIAPQSLVDEKVFGRQNSFTGLDSRELKLLKLFKRLGNDRLKDGFISMLEDILKLHKN